MIKRFSAGCLVLALMGCAPTIPDSNPNAQGVGFGDYNRYASQRAARDAQLEARISDENVASTAIAQNTQDVLNQTASAGAAPVSVASIEGNNPNISDEQDFEAVSSRETIESDRDRLARQRESFSVAQPEAVPERPSGRAAPNIVSFALSTNNAVGQSVYDRSGRFNEDRYRRACADFGSSDQAQAAFLAAGGPERDRRGLDPDGDGFACFWDPSPFRAARGG
ncbi:MAG: hypothetical protein AAGK71_04525 [Pseudomonadota bacterium]